MKTNLTFDHDWRVPPGATVQDIMASRDLLSGDVSAQLDLSIDDFEGLLNGSMSIDAGLALRLADVLGPKPAFWLKREEIFRRRGGSSDPEALEDSKAAFLKMLPLRDMKAFGWLSEDDGLTRTEAALRFFEDDYGDWRRNGRDLLQAVAFRTSKTMEANSAAVAAWLRQGVVQSNAVKCDGWSPQKLAEAVADIRPLTRLSAPATFFPKLVEIGQRAGVAIVFVRTPSGCRASGATHFSPSGTPIIQLSFRYRADDHFWFTVMHEIGHLVLHPASPMFVEGAEFVSGEEEAEADRFAQDTLIPPAMQTELLGLGRDFKKVMRFAKRAGVSPGVVVGQMQKRGLIRYDQLNFLKTRYDWSELKVANP